VRLCPRAPHLTAASPNLSHVRSSISHDGRARRQDPYVHPSPPFFLDKLTTIVPARPVIIGAGTSALIQAKTLLDDGFRAVSIVSSADRVGGVWARGPHGGIYPSLLTNSAWGNFEFSTKPMPKDNLTETDGRIRAETVSDYLQDFYEIYLEGRLDVQCVA
jgi:hypothetical protein